VGKTKKDRRDRDYFEEGKGKRRQDNRRDKQSWKQYKNTSTEEVFENYESEDDLVGDG